MSETKTIEIKCKTVDYLPLDELSPFQGRFKSRTEKDIKILVGYILEQGFYAPIYVWSHGGVNLILDGHGRYLALDYLRSQGYEIPPLPVVLITAENEKDARMKVLELNNMNGQFTKESLLEYSKELMLDFSDIHVVGLDLSDVQSMFKPELNPTISDRVVSDGEVQHVAEKMAKYNVPPDNHDYRDVQCPHCTAEFSVRVS